MNLARNAQLLIALCAKNSIIVECCHGEDGLQNARSTHCMTVVAFVSINGNTIESCSFDGNRLHLVVEDRGGTMGTNECERRFLVIVDHGRQG